MRSLSLVLLLVASAFYLAIPAQPLAAASARSHKHTQAKAHSAAHAASAHAVTHGRTAGKKASSVRGHGKAGLKAKAAPASAGDQARQTRRTRQVHGVGLPRNARYAPAVMRTRRGALRAARRRAHAEDARPPLLQRVRLAMPA